MLQILMATFWLLLVPFGSGLWITSKLPKEHQSIGMIILNGYLVTIAFFQCFYLGFLVAESTSFENFIRSTLGELNERAVVFVNC